MSGSQLNKFGHFYKLIVPSILQQNKLRIPKKFARKFGDELLGVATLTAPDDRIWLVTVRQIDQRFWFCNGWHEFVVNYSICTGHFLVFRYEGNSIFSVDMYVLAPYQIKDPFTVLKNVEDYGKQHHVLDEIDDGDSVEILVSPPTRVASNHLKPNTFDELVEPNTICRNYNLPLPQNCHNEPRHHPAGDSVRLQSPVQCTQGTGICFYELQNSADDVGLEVSYEKMQPEKSKRKKLKIDEENLDPSSADNVAKRSRECHSSAESAIKLKKVGRKEQNIDPNEQKPTAPHTADENCSKYYRRSSVRKRTVTDEGRSRVKTAAAAFKSVNPFCMVVLRSSYLYRGCILYLPSCFSRKHLNGVSGWIKLQFSDGKQWLVRCSHRAGGAKLSQGWFEFSMKNGFAEGDVCAFELLNSRDIVLKVTIFRV